VNKLIFLTLMAVLVSCSGGKNSTGYSFLKDMTMATPYEAQTENPIFFNKQTNQLAPKGTIARGFMPHPLDSDGNPKILNNNYPMNSYAWERGKMLYKANCVACHGDEGQGDGLVVTKGGYPKPPKFKSRRFKWSKRDKKPTGHVYNVITFGYGNMSSYSQQLYSKDRWYVAEYVRQMLMTKGKK